MRELSLNEVSAVSGGSDDVAAGGILLLGLLGLGLLAVSNIPEEKYYVTEKPLYDQFGNVTAIQTDTYAYY